MLSKKHPLEARWFLLIRPLLPSLCILLWVCNGQIDNYVISRAHFHFPAVLLWLQLSLIVLFMYSAVMMGLVSCETTWNSDLVKTISLPALFCLIWSLCSLSAVDLEAVAMPTYIAFVQLLPAVTVALYWLTQLEIVCNGNTIKISIGAVSLVAVGGVFTASSQLLIDDLACILGILFVSFQAAHLVSLVHLLQNGRHSAATLLYWWAATGMCLCFLFGFYTEQLYDAIIFLSSGKGSFLLLLLLAVRILLGACFHIALFCCLVVHGPITVAFTSIAKNFLNIAVQLILHHYLHIYHGTHLVFPNFFTYMGIYANVGDNIGLWLQIGGSLLYVQKTIIFSFKYTGNLLKLSNEK